MTYRGYPIEKALELFNQGQERTAIIIGGKVLIDGHTDIRTGCLMECQVVEPQWLIHEVWREERSRA